MKHCILVKWNKSVNDKNRIAEEVQNLFNNLLKLNGIHEVKIIKNVVDRENRYDLLIRIDLEKEILPVYDESETHHDWKKKYGKFVENKAIFDYEG